MAQMLARRERYRNPLGHLETEHVLGIVRRSGRIAVSPLREDFEHVGKMPVPYAAVRFGVDARLLGQFALRGMFERLSDFDASRHRLPVADIVSALHHENVEIGRINDDEDGNGLLKLQATNTQNPAWRSFQHSDASRKMSSSV